MPKPKEPITRIGKLLELVKTKLEAQGYGAKSRLAEHLKVRPQHLSIWLNNKRIPDADHALALLEWCNEN